MRRNLAAITFAVGWTLLPLTASAIGFELFGLEGTVNNTFTLGAQVRTERRAGDLVGKYNLDPGVCSAVYQSCQGLFKDQIYPSQQLVRSPGAPTLRGDNGNLNYDRFDLTQGSLRLAQDLTLTKGDFGFFARTISFSDAVNDRVKDRYRGLITRENFQRVGTTGDPIANRYFARVYGPGETVGLKRTDSTLRRQIVADVQFLDLNFYGKLNIPGTEKQFSFKLGRQNVNWGESTLLVINSINQAQPVNANNLGRVGFQVEEVFIPINMAFVSFEPIENSTVEAFYQLEWKPVEIPAPGSFYSTNDIGNDNIMDYVNLSFGSSADDKDKVGYYLDNPLALVTNTTSHISRLPDRTPSGMGQFGLALKNYFPDLNGGTAISFYFMNYHSRLPYVSFISGNASCARREGNTAGAGGVGIDARNTTELLRACPNLPANTDPNARPVFLQDVAATITANPSIIANNDLGISATDPLGGLATLQTLLGTPDPTHPDNLVPLDSGPFFLEYPKNIQLLGVSFNTTAGDYSFQGEVAYRPNLPLQVSVIDVAFGAAGPFLTRCQDPALDCAGSSAGMGFAENGQRISYGRSDADPNCVANKTCDTINLLLGAAPGSARSFPSFIIPYRGGTLGENPPNSYIRGFERFDVLQYNLGVTRVLGASDNPLGADQILLLGEIGATHVPGLPGLNRLQIDAPGVSFHASAGADGSGADGSKQACSTNPNCVVGPDGGRFNPHQANLHNFATTFSWGYRIVGIFRYESVLPGISIAPQIIWAHDVDGVAPGPGENFIRGRHSTNLNIETRYKSALSFGIGYNWFWGGREQNLLHDRDNASAYLRYQL